MSNPINIELIIIVAFSIVIIFLATYSLKLKLRNRKLIFEVVQSNIDKQILIDRIKEGEEKLNSASIENSDGFLKFISQSRDWAFDYIEQVQAALLEFKKRVEPEIEYVNTYGKALPKTAHSVIVDNIANAYADLTKIMPEDEPGNMVK